MERADHPQLDGMTLQLDLRDADFATAIAHYSFHIAKYAARSNPSQVQERIGNLSRDVMGSTMLKGYSSSYTSWNDLVRCVHQKTLESYGVEVFEMDHLRHLPSMIMVFSPDALVALALSDEAVKQSTARPGRNTRTAARHHLAVRVITASSTPTYTGFSGSKFGLSSTSKDHISISYSKSATVVLVCCTTGRIILPEIL